MSTVRDALALVTGSPLDADVVSLACDLTRASKGCVWVLYVIEIDLSLPVDAEVSSETTRGEQTLQRMEQLGKSLKCKVEGDILQARDMGAAIVREAADREVDVIITGMPYVERYGNPSLGEIAPYVLRHSHCRVVVYRGEQSEAQPAGTH